MLPQVPASKITPPSLPKVIERKRLLNRLAGDESGGVVLIVGQAAQGKSTLAASIVKLDKTPSAWVNIQREDADPAALFHSIIVSMQANGAGDLSELSGYPAMVRGPYDEGPVFRNWLDAVARKVGRSFRIVLDGMDGVEDGAPAWRFVRVLIEECRDQLPLLVTSRREPPFDIHALKMKREIKVITNDDLAFTLAETRHFLELLYRIRVSDQTLKHIHGLTEGWIGGLALLAGSLEWVPEDSWASFLEDHVLHRFRAEAFSFLGEEVFRAQPEEDKEMLLKTSIMESFDSDLAKEVSGLPDPEECLQGFVTRCLFVHRIYEEKAGWSFRYHKIFREFLDNRLRASMPEAEIKGLHHKAAVILEQRGRVHEAIGHYLSAGCFSKAAGVIEKTGLSLIRDGRDEDMAGWLRVIPEDIVRSNPWLLLFHSMDRSFAGAEDKLKDLSDAAYVFSQRGDVKGRLLALALMLEASVVRGNDVIPLGELTSQAQTLLMSSDGVDYAYEKANLWLQLGFALTVRGGNPRRGLWACENAFLIARELGERGLMAHAAANSMQAAAWLGEFDLADRKMEELKELAEESANPGVRFLWEMACVESNFFRGRFTEAEGHLNGGRMEVEASGFTYLNPVLLLYQMLIDTGLKRYREAEQTADRMFAIAASMGNIFMKGLSYLHKGRNQYFAGNCEEAALNLIRAREIFGSGNAKSDYHLAIAGILLGLVCINTGRPSDGEKDLMLALDYFSEISCFVRVEARLVLGLLDYTNGEKDEAAIHLRAGFREARDRRLFHFTILAEEDIKKICVLASELELKDVSDYVMDVISRMPMRIVEETLSRLQDHQKPQIRESAKRVKVSIHRAALPRLRIETLGSFKVTAGDTLLRDKDWHGSQPKRVLAAILSAGRAGIRRDMVIDCLWPDSDPASAVKTFKAALWRLRNSLEPNMVKGFRSSYVHLRGGMLCLDEELCEVDADEFVAMIELASEMKSREDVFGALGALEKAVELYRGDFIPDQVDSRLCESRREELRRKYISSLFEAGKLHEDRRALRKASRLYKMAINADPLFEAAYQRLMISYSEQGKRSEAIRLYGYLKRSLRESMNTNPDSLTTAIYKKIRD